MLAVVKEASGTGGRTVVRDAPMPAISTPDDVRVRIEVAGVCRTDLYAAEGRLDTGVGPRVLGHEGTGTVDAVGASVVGLSIGARVVIDPWLACGRCRSCRDGSGRCAMPRMVGVDHDGVFAEFAVFPRAALIAVPAELSPRHAAYVEPVAAALAVFDTGITVDGRGVVQGSNRIAQLTRRIMVSRGFRAAAEATTQGAAEETFDWAVETQATPEALAELCSLVRPGGLIVLKSRPAAGVLVDVATVVRKRLRLVGALYGAFDAAIALLASGRLAIDDLLGDIHPLADATKVLAAEQQGEHLKTFLAPRPLAGR